MAKNTDGTLVLVGEEELCRYWTTRKTAMAGRSTVVVVTAAATASSTLKDIVGDHMKAVEPSIEDMWTGLTEHGDVAHALANEEVDSEKNGTV